MRWHQPHRRDDKVDCAHGTFTTMEYHASVIGKARRMISDGWMRPKPKSSQRVAP